MPVRGGEFRHLISLQSRSTTQGAMGGQAETWTEYARVYAALAPLTGRELLAAQATQSAVTHTITIYWMPALTPAAAHRAVLGARIFDIKAVWNEDEANRVFVMQAVEGPTKG